MRNTTGEPNQGRWWRRISRRHRGAPETGAARSQSTAEAIQLAIGLLTASLDSPELRAWAVRSLPIEDPVALGDLLAGLHIVSQLLLLQVHEATGQPPAATLQALALAAETSREKPFGGHGSAGWPAI
jgi:hypothetical protein